MHCYVHRINQCFEEFQLQAQKQTQLLELTMGILKNSPYSLKQVYSTGLRDTLRAHLAVDDLTKAPTVHYTYTGWGVYIRIR